MPQISVIVPVYNVEKYIHRCVDSILAQTFTDFELILVDDGSTDKSGQICDQYANLDNRIHSYHQINSGQATARNRGIRLSKCKWLHFVDADDAIHPQTLDILYSAVIDKKVPISLCESFESNLLPEDLFDYISNPPVFNTIKIQENNLLRLRSTYHFHCVWGKLINREIIEKHMFTDGRFYEDSAVVGYWLLSASEIAITNEKLYFYYVNASGTTKGVQNIKKLTDNLWSREEQLKFAQLLLKENGYKKFYTEVASGYMLNTTCIYLELRNKDKEIAKKIRKKCINFYHTNKTYFNFNKTDSRLILEMLFPKSFSLFWTITALLNKIKRLWRF